MLFARDVFIGHAGPDKAAFATPLVRALGRHALSCWIDGAQIEAGDSLLNAINEGLASARCVAVVITERFMERSRPWPERELNAATHREIRSGQTIVIPVLAVPESEWFDRYPLMADKLYLPWSLGPDGVAARIAARFPRAPSRDWHCNHPEDHVGHVWMRVNASHARMRHDHRLTARWGPYVRHVELPALGPDPVSLVHHKTAPDAVMLHVEIDPPAIVTFGQGPPPDAPGLNIDEGWTRSAGWNFPASGPPRQL
jgi:hypothetical protein